MTRRERLERKLEKRQEWAGKASARSDAAFTAASRVASGIPFGQPILIGHHSERRHRRDQERIHAGMSRSVAESKLASHHESKARGLGIALERSIFDDDPDALERLREKMAGLEASRDQMKAANQAWKKRGAAGVVEVLGEELAVKVAHRAGLHGEGRPFASYAFTNTSAEIRRCKQRIAEIERQRARAELVAKSGGVLVTGGDWVTVTFEEKPARSVLDALRSAGFRWGKGSWHGERSKLPAEVTELAGDRGMDQALELEGLAVAAGDVAGLDLDEAAE